MKSRLSLSYPWGLCFDCTSESKKHGWLAAIGLRRALFEFETGTAVDLTNFAQAVLDSTQFDCEVDRLIGGLIGCARERRRRRGEARKVI